MSILERMFEASEEGFQRKVKYYMQKAAIAVLGELGTTSGHAERVIYANKILDGTASVYEYAVGVTTNATIADKIDTGICS